MDIIKFQNFSKTRLKKTVLHQLNMAIKSNAITGLVGPNGAGKTTLMKAVCGYIKGSSGNVEVFGENPFNSLMVSANTIFIDDQLSLPSGLNLESILDEAANFYINWDAELAKELLEYFDLDPYQFHDKLSKGARSTFNIILAISARCPLTIMDEPTIGMDASVRKDFYRLVLKDFLIFPRTILISGHYMEEMEDILEDVILLDKGQRILHLPIEELRQYAIAMQGKRASVRQWVGEREVIYHQERGAESEYVMVKNDFSDQELEQAYSSGISTTLVTASELCLHLMRVNKGGIQYVIQ